MSRFTRTLLKSPLAAALAMPLIATGQAQITTNFFTGTVGFTLNTLGSPADLLLVQYFNMNAATITATGNPKTQFTGQNATVGSPQVLARMGRSYTVTAEALDTNVGSVTYDLRAAATFGNRFNANQFWNQFEFNDLIPPNPLTLSYSSTNAPGPPTTAHFKECVGIATATFGSCPSSTTPIVLKDSYVRSNRSYTEASGLRSVIHHIAKPATPNAAQTFTLHYTTGTDSFSDLIQNEISFSATAVCDAVTPVSLSSAMLPGTCPCIGPSCPPNDLGKIIGLWDAVGYLENANNQRTLITAASGPFGNYRWDNLGGEPGSVNPPFNPVNPPRRFELENLVPGNYFVYGETSTRLNRAYTYIRSDLVQATSVKNQTTDLSSTFVMTPATIYGDILLTHTPPTGAPSPSGLADLYFSDASNVSGLPIRTDLSSGSRFGLSSGGSFSYTAWPFDPSPTAGCGSSSFNTGIGQFCSNYNLPVVRANPIPLSNVAGMWPDSGFTYFELRFGNGDTSPPVAVGADNKPRPTGNLVIAEATVPMVLNPGNQRKVDLPYCFGSATITYKISTGNLYDPIAEIKTGNYTGLIAPTLPPGPLTALFPRNANYKVSGNFKGIPQTAANKAVTGELTVTLPLGNYVFSPTVTTDDGSIARFTTIPIAILKCNEHVNATTASTMVCDVNGDGRIDQRDLTLISRARGKPALPGDPKDADRDGVITPADVKVCIPRCSSANCANQ